MSFRITLLFLIGIAFCFAQFAAADESALLPKPVKATYGEGSFTITPETKILYSGGDKRLVDAADYLAGRLSMVFDEKIAAKAFDGAKPVEGAILLTTAGAHPMLGNEGYELNVKPKSVVIRAPKAAGDFYGGITLLQLGPPEAFRAPTMVEGKLGGKLTRTPPRPADEPNVSNAKPVDKLAIQCAWICDKPRFSWRGLLIDPARHYYPIEELKQYADYLALHKMNKMQIHFTDSQNWTVEVMKYPNLTPEKAQNAADPNREKNQTYHNLARHYYTQDELRELVAYAKKRFVEVVPEFEMPGHCGGLLRGIPEVGCLIDGKRIGGAFICPGQEETYTILQSILDEMLDIVPGRHIHIGADETRKDNWKKCVNCQKRMKDENIADVNHLHGYFVGRMSDYLQKKGRTLVGWDEILESGSKPGAIGMYWRSGTSDELVKKAALNGQFLVMTPTAHCYLDFRQTEIKDETKEPVGFGNRFITLRQSLALNPVPDYIKEKSPDLVLGLQGNLWGERIKSFPHALYQTYPRACALAEVAWSPDVEGGRDYAEFFARLQKHVKRLDAAGINYRKPTEVDRP